jgi:hypothetical protein
MVLLEITSPKKAFAMKVEALSKRHSGPVHKE